MGTHRKAQLTAIAALLVVPALAYAAHPRSGAFTSARADIHVGGSKITNADVNCKLQGGVTSAQMSFGKPVNVKRSGSFYYRGAALYVHSTASGYKSRMTTAVLTGRFVSPKRVKGKVKGGPGACHKVSFSANYNAHAH